MIPKSGNRFSDKIMLKKKPTPQNRNSAPAVPLCDVRLLR
jgi:hypothetical protein